MDAGVVITNIRCVRWGKDESHLARLGVDYGPIDRKHSEQIVQVHLRTKPKCPTRQVDGLSCRILHCGKQGKPVVALKDDPVLTALTENNICSWRRSVGNNFC